MGQILYVVCVGIVLLEHVDGHESVLIGEREERRRGHVLMLVLKSCCLSQACLLPAVQ